MNRPNALGKLLGAALGLCVLVGASAASAQTVLIENATVWTAPDTKLDGAAVLFKDGTIRAVGVNIAAPAGATRIDGTGKVVTIGLIDAMTRLGLSEVLLVGETNDGNFGGQKRSVFASYRAADGYNESSVSIPLGRSHGVTTVVAAPDGGFISGIGSAFSLADPSAKTTEIGREIAMYANLGGEAMSTNEGSRGLAIVHLREILDDAATYSKNKAAFERNQSRRLAASRLDLEALLLVTKRALPLVVRADRASDIRAALRIAKGARIRLVIAGGTEAWKLADELAAQKVAVVLDPSANLPSSFDRVLVREDSAAVLAKAGVTVVISTLGDSANVRNLRQLAGIGVARGLSFSQALAAVTTNPAVVFGLGKRTGVAVGNAADLVLWSGDPFEISTAAERVFIGGVEQSLETRQTRLLRRYRKLPSP